jgi:hypothetical protein
MLTLAFPSKPFRLTLSRGLALSGLLLLLLLAAETGTATPSSGIVCNRNVGTEKWTLQAEQTPFLTLLSTLATRAGFEVIGTAPAASSITIQVDQVPLEQVLRSLLKQGGCNYSLLYRGDRLQRVVLIDTNLQWAHLPEIAPAVALSEGPPAAAIVPALPAASSSRLARPPGDPSIAIRRNLERARWLQERSSAVARRGPVVDNEEESEWDNGDAEE